jgi:hypothetical protein
MKLHHSVCDCETSSTVFVIMKPSSRNAEVFSWVGLGRKVGWGWCFIGEAIQRSPEELREPALELVDTPIREYASRQSQSDGSPFMDVSASQVASVAWRAFRYC